MRKLLKPTRRLFLAKAAAGLIAAPAIVRAQVQVPFIAHPRLAYDLFTGANGTDIASHTMNIGSGWTDVVGTHWIQGKLVAAEHACERRGSFDVSGAIRWTLSGDPDRVR